jgi:hypothetical protein
VERGEHRHQRDGQRSGAGLRRCRPDPRRRAPRAHVPPLDVSAAAPDPRPRDRRRDRGRRRDGPERTFHPDDGLALVVAAARLAEGYLRERPAGRARTSGCSTRNLPHLVGLRDEPGALLSPERAGARARKPRLAPGAGRPARGGQPRAAWPRANEGRWSRSPRGWPAAAAAGPGPAAARGCSPLAFLGATRPTALLDGRPVAGCSPRHAELLALLALHPEGRTPTSWPRRCTATRARRSRCGRRCTGCARRSGSGVLPTRSPTGSPRAVDGGFPQRAHRPEPKDGLRDAALLYRGELLPRSDAPEVREERDLLAAAVHAAVRRTALARAPWTARAPGQPRGESRSVPPR